MKSFAMFALLFLFLANPANAERLGTEGIYASPRQGCAMNIKFDPTGNQDLVAQYMNNPLYINAYCNSREIILFQISDSREYYRYDNGVDTYCLLSSHSEKPLSFNLFCYWKIDNSLRNMDSYNLYSY